MTSEELAAERKAAQERRAKRSNDEVDPIVARNKLSDAQQDPRSKQGWPRGKPRPQPAKETHPFLTGAMGFCLQCGRRKGSHKVFQNVPYVDTAIPNAGERAPSYKKPQP